MKEKEKEGEEKGEELWTLALQQAQEVQRRPDTLQEDAIRRKKMTMMIDEGEEEEIEGGEEQLWSLALQQAQEV